MMLADGSHAVAMEISTLLGDGTVTLDDVCATFIQRAGERLIISFSKNGETRWINDICTEEAFSQLKITSKTPDAFETPQILGFLGDFAREQNLAGTKITLCATGEYCRSAVVAGQAFNDPITILFDPIDISESASALVFYDPFLTRQPSTAKNRQWLKCFASNGDTVSTLTRMQLDRAVLPAALQGELDPTHFYALLRKRHDYRFYRIAVENALKARGKSHRVPQFRELFRARRVAQSLEVDALHRRAAEARPQKPGAWARLRRDTSPSPSEGGNVWMLQSENGRLRYLSDRWQGITMGYVEQDGITLAETPGTAIGIAAFGDGQQVERPLTRRFPWHVVDARLDGSGPAFGATSEATLSLEQLHAEGAGLVTAIALGTAQPGITADEALPDAPRYLEMISHIEMICSALDEWNMALFVDRLRLSLLTGAPNTPENDAACHYREVAHALSRDISTTTGQSKSPTVVIVPHAGLRRDGNSEVSLAEARFDLDNPTVDALIPTPAYPFRLMAEMPATHTPEAALLMDELCVLALRAHQNGERWHCPQLQFAEASGTTVTAQFSTMDGLMLQDGPHGFHLIGDGAPKIKSIEVTSDTEVTMNLASTIDATGLQLAYAWGHRSDRTASDHAANHGALRDRWQRHSSAIEGHVLHRFALPARVPLHLKD
ncbi:MAG: hypothetical protein AAFY06_05330 [Pseudomonadota bacterium]